MTRPHAWRSRRQFVTYVAVAAITAFPVYAWLAHLAGVRSFLIIVILSNVFYLMVCGIMIADQLMFGGASPHRAAGGTSSSWRRTILIVGVLVVVGGPYFALLRSGHLETGGSYALISILVLYFWVYRYEGPIEDPPVPSPRSGERQLDQIIKASALYVMAEVPILFAAVAYDVGDVAVSTAFVLLSIPACGWCWRRARREIARITSSR